MFILYTCDDKAPEASLQPSALLLHQGHPVQVVHQVAASIRHHQGLTMGTCSPEHAGQIRYPPLESQHPHKMVTMHSHRIVSTHTNFQRTTKDSHYSFSQKIVNPPPHKIVSTHTH